MINNIIKIKFNFMLSKTYILSINNESEHSSINPCWFRSSFLNIEVNITDR